jgi:hypothetical protein
MSRLIRVSMLLALALASGAAWSQTTARQLAVEDVLGHLRDGYVTALPNHHFFFRGSIVPPGGEIRTDQVVECDGKSLIIRDPRTTTTELYPADEAFCAELLERLAGGPAGERHDKDTK